MGTNEERIKEFDKRIEETFAKCRIETDNLSRERDSDIVGRCFKNQLGGDYLNKGSIKIILSRDNSTEYMRRINYGEFVYFVDKPNTFDSVEINTNSVESIDELLGSNEEITHEEFVKTTDKIMRDMFKVLE